MNVDTPFFRLENACVVYGKYRAVDNLDLSISTGEVVGLLGDNGAGKSTTIKLMSGTTRLSSGDFKKSGGSSRTDMMAELVAIAVQIQATRRS